MYLKYDEERLTVAVPNTTEELMRTMLKVTMSAEGGNRAIKEGTIGKLIGGFSEEHRPENSYFMSENGRRTALFFFDLKDPSQIPAIAEPFFLQLNAEVTFTPVMNAEDLQKGLAVAAKKF